MKQARIFVSGLVQGVGFRHFIRSKAVELGLTGFVQNLSDGRVEAILQGSKEKIDELIRDCNKGPFLSEVENITVESEEEKEIYKDFEIR